MPTITLIRHGQASFGSENYDQLSPLGFEQTKHLGVFFTQTARQIDHVIIGGMKRHQQSFDSFMSAYDATQIAELNAMVMPNYNEFDHEQVLLVGNQLASKAAMGELLASHPKPKAKLYELFSNAVARWQAGNHDEEYTESWSTFKKRTWQAFLDTVDVVNQMQSNKDTEIHCVVFSSGGVISAIAGELLGLSDRKIFELNFTMANAAMTQIKVKGERKQLLSLNEYSYLNDAKRQLITWH